MKAKALGKLGAFVTKNSPTILTGMGVAGLVSTTILAVKATPKALQLIEDEMQERAYIHEMEGKLIPFTKVDYIKAAWKCYIPAAVMGGVTIACIIGANSINLKRNAALASLYTLSETALKEYQAKVVETIGERKEREVRDKVAKEKITRNPKANKEVVITGRGDVLCFDATSGRYFKSEIEHVRRLQNDLNQRLISEMWISLNEVYYELGLKPISIGDDIGWNSDCLIDFDFSSQLADDGTPCVVIDYTVGPRYDYRSMY